MTNSPVSRNLAQRGATDYFFFNDFRKMIFVVNGGPYSKHWAIETHPVAAHRGATGLVIAPAIDSRFQLHHPTASPNAQNWSPPRSCQSTRAPSSTHQELIFGGVHPQLD